MKRICAAALATASAAGIMAAATPAFAAMSPSLTIVPIPAFNGDRVAITGKCPGDDDTPVIVSPVLHLGAIGKAGKPLFVELKLGSRLMPGMYAITLGCTDNGKIQSVTSRWLTVKHPMPGHTPAKLPDDFMPDVVVNTGLGGMARFVAGHHPVR